MIEIKDLNKHYGALHAVRDLSLFVPRGELFCFLGPNGAGKTTTIKILTGLLHPSSGSARLGGIDIQQDPVAAKRMIGYIPDMPYLYDRLTTTEFYQFTGELFGVPRPKVDAELERSFKLFGLLDHRNALVKDLSHGLRQRLIYASVFLHEPEILFIDEPLIGLDPYTIRLIKDLLVRKAREGMTIFLTTHILALAQDIADRIGIITNGSLATLGTLADLLERHGGSNLEDMFLRLTKQGTDGLE
jgi:ABC-2 type transport system ATP-binding protein